MKKKIPKQLLLGVLILICLAGAALYKLYAPRESGITATGTVEVTKVDITPKMNGYINGLSIDVGDTVENGQMILQVDRPDLRAEILRDEAALAKAQSQLHNLEIGSRSQELEEAEAAVQSAQSVYDKSQRDDERYSSLYNSGAISAQQLDASKSTKDVSYRSLQSALAKLNLAQEGYRPEEINSQRLEVERTQAVLKETRSLMSDTVVNSPISGLVLSKNFEDGEYVSAGSPVVTIGNMEDCWVRVYVSSNQLGLIQIGQQVKVQIDSFPDKIFEGKIKEISQNAEYTPRQSITQRERANMVFAVKVKLDNSEGIFKPGMPADVVIL